MLDQGPAALLSADESVHLFSGDYPVIARPKFEAQKTP
jgi:hypothetical protein